MSKFKVGDRVKIVRCDVHGTDLPCHHMRGLQGSFRISRDDGTSDHPYRLNDSLGDWGDRELELTGDMNVGDTLTDKDGCTTKILAVVGGDIPIYGLSEYNDHDRFNRWCTAKDLEDYGLKLQPEITEKTVAEVEKELNLTAGSLRIKK